MGKSQGLDGGKPLELRKLRDRADEEGKPDSEQTSQEIPLTQPSPPRSQRTPSKKRSQGQSDSVRKLRDFDQTLKNEFEHAQEEEARSGGSGKQLSGKDRKYIDLLKTAIAENSIETKSVIAQRFMRTVSQEQLKSYRGLKNNAERNAFGVAWAKEEAACFERGKSEEKSWRRRVDTSHGTFKTLGAIAESYGWHADPEAAATSAFNYASKCVKLGGPWVRFDDFSQTLMFFHLVVGRQEEFAKSWRIYKNQYEGGSLNKNAQMLEGIPVKASPWMITKPAPAQSSAQESEQEEEQEDDEGEEEMSCWGSI